ncbi:MAG: hypothetical protein QM536_00215 [Chitinophagaceae bacterium]|nr:hypothetical protein [Chitinophagaceae bacterium]
MRNQDAMRTTRIDGKIKEKRERIIKDIKRGKLTLTEIAEDFEIFLDVVIPIKKTYKNINYSLYPA